MSIEFNKKRIAVLPWPNKPNCYLCLSGAMKSSSDVCEAKITFAYKGESVAAEWNGEHGPIQIWYKCDESYQEEYDKARPHWLFDYAHGSGCWSQMAVDENNLVEAFNQGDYDHIFSVLKRFVVGREEKC